MMTPTQRALVLILTTPRINRWLRIADPNIFENAMAACMAEGIVTACETCDGAGNRTERRNDQATVRCHVCDGNGIRLLAKDRLHVKAE